MRYCTAYLFAFMLTVLLAGCGGGGSSSSSSVAPPPAPPAPPPAATNQWTWVSGSASGDAAGVYGAKGSAAAANTPGARGSAASWTDRNGSLWLFGGSTGDSASANGLSYHNDLWRFDGSNWAWMGGSDTVNQPGVYGSQGAPSAANIPGARDGAVTWVDSQGNFWLFGGFGYDSTGTQGYLNDLWKFDGTNWTWVSGADTADDPGDFGSQGVPSATSRPAARANAASWIDTSGNLWLFSGSVLTVDGVALLNDLWKFDGSNWTFAGGNSPASYGTLGTPSPSNIPGARLGAVSWTDRSGNFWLFGGMGYDVTNAVAGDLNDMWRFDGTSWTWISGSQSSGDAGSYGAIGVAAASNTPGARHGTTGWTDAAGNLWLFGGRFDDLGDFNDLWKFDGSNWTWVSGSNSLDPEGSFGTRGVAAAGNLIGPRSYPSSWVDRAGRFWIFGGDRTTPTATQWLNDLWSYTPG